MPQGSCSHHASFFREGAGFEFNLGRESCFSFIPTPPFLHQPYMIYSIFIANIVMKPCFVQTEAAKRELVWFGGGWRWRASCRILFLLQVRKTQFKADPGPGRAHGCGDSCEARTQTDSGVWVWPHLSWADVHTALPPFWAPVCADEMQEDTVCHNRYTWPSLSWESQACFLSNIWWSFWINKILRKLSRGGPVWPSRGNLLGKFCIPLEVWDSDQVTCKEAVRAAKIKGLKFWPENRLGHPG